MRQTHTSKDAAAGRVSSFAAMLAAVGIIVQLVDVKRNWCKMYQICQCWSNVVGILFAHLLRADACNNCGNSCSSFVSAFLNYVTPLGFGCSCVSFGLWCKHEIYLRVGMEKSNYLTLLCT